MSLSLDEATKVMRKHHRKEAYKEIVQVAEQYYQPTPHSSEPPISMEFMELWHLAALKLGQTLTAGRIRVTAASCPDYDSVLMAHLVRDQAQAALETDNLYQARASLGKIRALLAGVETVDPALQSSLEAIERQLDQA